MKEIISLILATTTLLMTQINSYAKSSDVTFEIIGNTLSVSGNVGTEAKKDVLLRVIKNPNNFNLTNDIVYIEQKMSDSNGAFSFECEFPDNSQSATELADFTAKQYTFSVGVIGDDSDYTSNIINFYGDDYQAKVIALLNSAKNESKTNQVDAITKAKSVLDTAYANLYVGAKKFEEYKTDGNYNGIIKYFLGLPNVETVVNIKEQLEEASAITVLNLSANDVNKVRDMVESEDGQISLGINNSTALKSYYDFKNLCGDQILTSYAKSSISNINESKEKYEFAVISNALKQSVTAYQVKLLIETNKEILCVTDSKYQLTDEEYGKLTGKSITALSDVKTMMNEIINNREKGQQQGSSGGGGGSSSFGTVSISEPANETTKINTLPFNDIENFDWANDSIEYLYSKGIVSGKGDAQFAPADNVTREEFLKMMLVAFGIGKCEEPNSKFTDINSGEWYAGYVYEACNRGVVSGVSENVFGVKGSIKRQDVAVIVYRTLENLDLLDEEVEYNCDFTDKENIAEYAKKSVAYMKDKDIISGYPDGSFNPNGNITRAEAAVIIKRVIDYVNRIYKGGVNL